MASGRSGMSVRPCDPDTGGQSGIGLCLQGNWTSWPGYTHIHIAWLHFHGSGTCGYRQSNHEARDPKGDGLPSESKHQGLKMPICRNDSIFAVCGPQGRIRKTLPIYFDRGSEGFKMALRVISVNLAWSSLLLKLYSRRITTRFRATLSSPERIWMMHVPADMLDTSNSPDCA